MRLNSRDIVFRAPHTGVLVYSHAFYTQPRGLEKCLRRSEEVTSDLFEAVQEAFSADNGRTWSPLVSQPVLRRTPRGTYRLFLTPGFVDPETGYLVEMLIEGVLPSDDAIEDGMRHYYMRYRVSADGGRTWPVNEQVVQRGTDDRTGGPYTPERPFRGVTVGKNSMMLGDLGSATIRARRSGALLVPVQVCPVGPDGEYENPGGGYTYHDAAVLIGRWATHLGPMRIEWDLSDSIRNDPRLSTRGCVEPTIAQFPDGRILMVLRGSNDVKPDLPGRKWYTVSHDEGWTWEPVRPWTYDTAPGEPFFSPSSMSQLVAHSNGRFYWLGNLTPCNPRGNSPRYPFVIGAVDPASLLLRKESVTVIDTRGPGEPEAMTLSNFFAHEDRQTGEVVVHMSRWMLPEWVGDAYMYRIGV